MCGIKVFKGKLFHLGEHLLASGVEEVLRYYRHYSRIEEGCENSNRVDRAHYADKHKYVASDRIPAKLQTFLNINDKEVHKYTGDGASERGEQPNESKSLWKWHQT